MAGFTLEGHDTRHTRVGLASPHRKRIEYDRRRWLIGRGTYCIPRDSEVLDTILFLKYNLFDNRTFKKTNNMVDYLENVQICLVNGLSFYLSNSLI